MNLSDFRQQYPQYNDLSDSQLADGIYNKYYSDMPRADFDQKLGISAAPAKPVAPPMSAGDTAVDVVKSAGVGVGKGAIGVAGMGGDLWSLVDAGLSKAGVSDPNVRNIVRRSLLAVPTIGSLLQTKGSAEIQKGVESVTGEFYKPQTTAGEYAQTVGEFVPGMAVPGGGGLVRRGITALGAGLGSEAAGQATKGTAVEPYARVLGAVGGGVAPSALSRVVTPLPTSQARRDAVDTLRREGVTDLTAGDVTGRQGLRYFESEMGGGRGAAMAERKAEQFTAAALRRAGIQGETRATPEVLDNAFARIGQQFDDIAARNNVVLDRNLSNELVRIEGQYNRLTGIAGRTPAVSETIQNIGDVAARTGGVLDGASYSTTRSLLDKEARALVHSNPPLSDALFGIRNALDDAMARSMADPRDRLALRTARREYKNMLVLEKAATAAGENAALGLISPSALRNATVGQNRRAYARGRGDFADLAHAGEAVLKSLPQSGTAPRLLAQRMGTGVGSVLGSLMGGSAGSAFGEPVTGAAIGAALGTMVPHAAGRAALSAPARAYLGNQLLSGPPASSRPALQGLLSRPTIDPTTGLPVLPY